MTSAKNRRSWRKKAENKGTERTEKTEAGSIEIKPSIDSPEKIIEKPLDSSNPSSKPLDSSSPGSQPILMVEVVNVTHEKFKQTEEIKVI